jgi:2'-5' RNA ligase
MTDATMIRTFICIELPDDLKATIAAIQEQFKAHKANVSWVRPDNIHLTLKFLGDVEQQRLPGIAALVSDITKPHSPFSLIPEGHGVFPNAKSPRVFWLGIKDETGQLLNLQDAIESAMESLGFAREHRTFQPHLTIGRVRPYRKPKELTPAFMNITFAEPPFTVEHVAVMQSDLKPTGAVYTPLHVVKLG